MRRFNNGFQASRLTEALIGKKLITLTQLSDAKEERNNGMAGMPLQRVLIEKGFVREDDVIEVYSKVFDIHVFNPDKDKVDSSASKLISDKTAKHYGVFPVRKEGNILILAMTNPSDILAIDNIAIMAKMRVKPILAKRSDIKKCIDKYYDSDDDLYDILKSVEVPKIEVARSDESEDGIFDLKTNRFKSSVAVRLANFILCDAIKHRASDIHIEPHDNIVLVRYRVDGKLKNMTKVPRSLHSALVARIKILTKLDITEKTKPQDGRVRIVVDDRKIDLRIATMPTFYGEKIAIRLLDTKEARVELGKLGFHREELITFRGALCRQQGMILVTGPTGSGKTSTLYAALNYMKNETKNIITIEDPIEYLIDGINQMQVNPIKDITFANGLRNILRQDPNVILVGEIRDRKAAEIAFRAALTGHLVFSSLHTNNAVSSITRLLDIGLEPSAVASSLIMIVSQRLVRLICPKCKEPCLPNNKALEKFSTYIDRLGITDFYRGRGCKHCNFTGYLGRTAIFEILQVNDKIKNLIANKASEDMIFNEAKKNYLRPLVESGMEKVDKGLTTLEEIATCVDVVSKKKKSKPAGKDDDGLRQRTLPYGGDMFYTYDDDAAGTELN